MIERFFTETFTQYRQEWLVDGEGNDYTDTVEIGEISGHIQQAHQDLVERFNLNFQTAYSVWCDVSEDVKIGDLLETDTDTYSVRGVQNNDIGRNKHLELAVEGGATVES